MRDDLRLYGAEGCGQQERGRKRRRRSEMHIMWSGEALRLGRSYPALGLTTADHSAAICVFPMAVAIEFKPHFINR